jgi:hypothetical protein
MSTSCSSLATWLPFTRQRHHSRDRRSKTPLGQLVSVRRLWPAVYPTLLNRCIHAVCRRTVPPVRGLGERL